MSFCRPNETAPVAGRPVRGRERQTRLAGERAAAGFPSPADEYLEQVLDLNEFLIHRPEATYFLRVSGESMSGAGILDNDILVVDRSLPPKDNSMVVALVDNDFIVRRFRRMPEGALVLVAEDPGHDPILITPDSECEIWGVVLHAIHTMHP